MGTAGHTQTMICPTILYRRRLVQRDLVSWQDMMSPYFQLPEGAHADENMIEWEEVFHTD